MKSRPPSDDPLHLRQRRLPGLEGGFSGAIPRCPPLSQTLPEALDLLDRAVCKTFFGPRRDRAEAFEKKPAKQTQFAFLPAALVFAPEDLVIEMSLRMGICFTSLSTS